MDLDNNYRIVYDENNVILQFFEQREKMIIKRVVDKETDKPKRLSIPSGEFYEHTENFYYPNMKTALTAFLMKSLRGSETIENVLNQIARVELIILRLK